MRTFLLTLALTSHCFAAGVTFVAADGIRSGGTGTSLATTAGINVASGAIAIVGTISNGANAVSTVTTSDGGDSCSSKVVPFLGSAAIGQEVWYCNNLIANASKKFTVTWAGAVGSRAVLVSVYTGQDSVTPLQTSFVLTGCNPMGATTCQSGTLTTTAANETLVAVATSNTGGTFSDVAGFFTNRVGPAGAASAMLDRGSGGGLLTATGYSLNVQANGETGTNTKTVSLIGIVPSAGATSATAVPVVF